MKRIALVLSTAAAACLMGCVVTSVSPFYTETQLVSEPALLGNWANEKNPGEVWMFEKSSPLAYRLTVVDARKATVVEACAFRLEGQLFLDVLWTEPDIHVMPVHYLLKVSQIAPSLRMSELDHAWLRDLLAKEPALLRHYVVKIGEEPEYRRVVLTGDTAELQSFVIAHLQTKEAWKESFDLKPETPRHNLPFDAMGGSLAAR